MNNYECFFEEVITNFPKIKKGMRFEVLNSIYETENRKSIKIAISAKDKKREFKDFLKEGKNKKGDILIVKDTDGFKAICENMNNEKEITISCMDILENNIKIIQRLRSVKLN